MGMTILVTSPTGDRETLANYESAMLLNEKVSRVNGSGPQKVSKWFLVRHLFIQDALHPAPVTGVQIGFRSKAQAKIDKIRRNSGFRKFEKSMLTIFLATPDFTCSDYTEDGWCEDDDWEVFTD